MLSRGDGLRSGVVALALLAAGAGAAQPLAPAPEAATGRKVQPPGTATAFMVAAANPLAAEAGREILRAGGSAVDAAIAVQLVLNLVEPQSSGIGGGAFLVHWDQGARRVATLDGRETAPAAARPERFLAPDGRPMPFMQAVVGGRSVGVPGTVRVLEAAHRRWGRLPWPRLFEPAVRLAEAGFAVSPRLNGLLGRDNALRGDPIARAYFFQADGTPKPVGAILRNPAFAETLRRLAREGADAFYEGAIAQDVVATVTGHDSNPGDMALADLKGYAAVERPAVCGRYRVYTICGMGPPSSGGIAVLQMLGMIEARDLARLGPGAEAAHWLAEAGRLAFADRALHLGDPAFVSVPVRGLTDPGYLGSRGALIDPNWAMDRAPAGDPPFRKTMRRLSAEEVEHGTSHIAVVDAAGDAVAMTTTVEYAFGAQLMTRGGFLLNNELTDFNFVPVEDGRPVANRVEPGKRPRSSMAPTLVFDAFGRLYVVAGSAGGSAIIPYVAKTLVAILDWKLDPQTAVDLPNIAVGTDRVELEAGTEAKAWAPALAAKGHAVRLVELTSGTQAIVITPAGFIGGADGRKEGVAIGD